MKTEIIYLISKDGIINTYENKQDAFKKLGFNFIVHNLCIEIAPADRDKLSDRYYTNRFAHRMNVERGKTYGELFKELSSYGEMKFYGDFILKNEYNEHLTVLDFAQFVFKEQKDKTHTRFGCKFWNGEGAVPYTGKRTYGRYYRRPKTLALLKDTLSTVDEDEIEFNVKNRRQKGRVITAWDDLKRESSRINNWKRYRKTQYK